MSALFPNMTIANMFNLNALLAAIIPKESNESVPDTEDCVGGASGVPDTDDEGAVGGPVADPYDSDSEHSDAETVVVDWDALSEAPTVVIGTIGDADQDLSEFLSI